MNDGRGEKCTQLNTPVFPLFISCHLVASDLFSFRDSPAFANWSEEELVPSGKENNTPLSGPTQTHVNSFEFYPFFIFDGLRFEN